MSCWANINHLRSKVKGRCHTPRWANQGNLSAHEKYLLLHSYLEEVGKTAEPEKSLWLTMSTFGFFSHFFPMWTCESGRFMAVTSPSHLSFSFLWKNVTCFASPHSPSIKNNSTHFFFHLCIQSTKPRSQWLCEDSIFPQTPRFSLSKSQILKNCKLI